MLNKPMPYECPSRLGWAMLVCAAQCAVSKNVQRFLTSLELKVGIKKKSRSEWNLFEEDASFALLSKHIALSHEVSPVLQFQLSWVGLALRAC